MMHVALQQVSAEFDTLRNDIDQFVDELELQMLKLCSSEIPERNGRHNSNHSWSYTPPTPTKDTSDIAEIRSLRSSGVCFSQSSNESTLTRSTVYSDFEEDVNSFEFVNSKSATKALLDSAFQENATKEILLPSEISSFCSNINNMRHINLSIKSMLSGKVAPEMCPDYSQPALILTCQLGSWKWYTCKSAQQIKAFDKIIRSWLDLEHLKIPRLPDLSPTTSPKACHTNHRIMEEYIVTISAHLSRLNDHVLSAFARFLESNPVVPSPIFDTSCYAYIKSTVGYKIRFCVFTNSVLQIYDAPGGKVLKQISLYLSSVQSSENQRNTISIQEFNSKVMNVTDQTIISFENDLVCDKWLQMLQGATHTKTPFSHTVAALPYTLTTWKD